MRTLFVLVPLIVVMLTPGASTATPEERSQHEKDAIVALRTIQTAEMQYFSQFGRYANSLRQLGERDSSGKSTPEASGLLDPELAAGVKNGYRFTMESVGEAAYSISAAPTVFGTTGNRTYYSDQTGAIHEHKGPQLATVQDPEVRL